MLEAIDRICSEATAAIEDGFSIIVLSDRNISASRMALSSLIACGPYIIIWSGLTSELVSGL